MIRFDENVRLPAIITNSEVAKLFEAGKAFSVMIANGRAEVFFKMVNGQWQTRTMTYDKIFGYIKSKWQEVKFG